MTEDWIVMLSQCAIGFVLVYIILAFVIILPEKREKNEPNSQIRYDEER